MINEINNHLHLYTKKIDAKLYQNCDIKVTLVNKGILQTNNVHLYKKFANLRRLLMKVYCHIVEILYKLSVFSSAALDSNL